MSKIIYQDKVAILQVIGCLLKKPSLLFESNYNIVVADFPELFHRIIFSVMVNLVKSNVKDIDIFTVDCFLSQYTEQYAIYEKNSGLQYLNDALSLSSISNFDYYYGRLKKFSLLREYDYIGVNVNDIYDPLALGVQAEELQEKFDGLTVVDIINHYEAKLLPIKTYYLKEQKIYGQQAGVNLKQLKESLKGEPAYGLPLYSEFLNEIARGARLGKLYMRSSPSGFGKTRLSLADACNLGIDEIYNTSTKQWEQNNKAEPTLFITTELGMDEIQTMLLAFVSAVPEDHILDGKYQEGEEERVDYAIQVLEKSTLYLEHVPNFDFDDIEQVVKMYSTLKQVKYVFFDYIHTSLKMLTSLSQQSKGMKLREDNVLLMFVDKLKTLCNQLGVFIFTSTQVNGEWKTVKDADQNLLRGAKSMADYILKQFNNTINKVSI